MVISADVRRTDRVAIVTGASRGMGRETIRRLASLGYAVVVNYLHDQRAADSTVDAVLDARGLAVAVRADVSDALDVNGSSADARDVRCDRRRRPWRARSRCLDSVDRAYVRRLRRDVRTSLRANVHRQPNGKRDSSETVARSSTCSARSTRRAVPALRRLRDHRRRRRHAHARARASSCARRDITVNGVSLDGRPACAPRAGSPTSSRTCWATRATASPAR
jgi:NAD(P)-dependent dehydrogenase (short-subunit alcohol dehydrogenase family)